MVPEIKISQSIKKALNYNEQKVQLGKAELIHAGNFLQLPEELNFHDKTKRFEKQMELNDRAKTKTMHLSLNFHPSEKEKLDKELLIKITDEYMRKIGFGDQPYLVYQHNDAGHPHVHVVTITIREDGSRINTHNLGRNESEKARKELEHDYALVKADKKEQKQDLKKELEQKAVDAQKVQYGKSETKRSITNVLDVVINQYKYTSLPELNAVLRQYNVMADRGNEDGRIYKNRGLNYRILDEKGQKVGVPVKASSIYSKPTLDYLEKKYEENKLARVPEMKHLKNAIDWTLLQKQKTLAEFINALEKERVTLVVRRNEQGRIFGLTYIDHERKTVFNGSDIGKEYAAKRILERLGLEEKKELGQEQKHQHKKSAEKQNTNPPNSKEQKQQHAMPAENNFKWEIKNELPRALELLMKPEESNEQLAYELTEQHKRKKKKEQSRNL